MTVPHPDPQPARPFVGVHMRCCNTYVRAYMNKDGTEYVGWCPRCATPVHIAIAEEGSESRFFEAS